MTWSSIVVVVVVGGIVVVVVVVLFVEGPGKLGQVKFVQTRSGYSFMRYEIE